LEVLYKERVELGRQLTSYFTGERLRKPRTTSAAPTIVAVGIFQEYSDLQDESGMAVVGKLELLDLVNAAGLLEHLRQSFNCEGIVRSLTFCQLFCSRNF
jgi:hypothetical protein